MSMYPRYITSCRYAASWAVIDWFTQSWNTTRTVAPGNVSSRVLDFFPALDDAIDLSTAYAAAPAKVATAAFYRLAAEGGVLVSGARALVSSNVSHYVTRTAFIGVELTIAALGPVIVRTNMARPLSSLPPVALTELGDGGLVLVDIAAAGEGVAIFSSLFPPASFAISPLGGCPAQYNHWGGPKSTAPAGVGVVLRPCEYGPDGHVAPHQRFARNASSGTFALSDGRCLSLATCAGSNGDLVTLSPCVTATAPLREGDPIGCDDGGGDAPCGAHAQVWSVTSNSSHPPNAIIASLGGRCMDVNGAFDANHIDVWDCGDPPGQYRNEEFVYNVSSGGIVSLDTDACCFNMCITPGGG